MKTDKKSIIEVIVAVGCLALLGCLALAQTTNPPSIRQLDGTSGVVTPTTSIATNGYRLVLADQFIELPSTNITVTLPSAPAGGFVNGKEFIFKNLSPHGTNQIVYSGTTFQNIDGQTAWQLTNQYASMHIRCDGTQWYIVNSTGAAYIP